MGLWRRIANNVLDVWTFGPRVLLRYFSNDAVIRLRDIGPVQLRRRGSDFECFRLVFERGDYDIGIVPAVDRRIHDQYLAILAAGRTPLVVDCGANVGASALWFARKFPEATVKAIEPDPDNFRLLAANTRTHSRIEPIHAAVGATSGFVEVLSSPERGDAVRTKEASQGTPMIPVNRIVADATGSELLLVKVDIEGFEKALFEANLEWLDEAYAIVVEPHDWMLPGQFSSRPFLRALSNRDFEMFIVGENLFFVRA